MNSWDLFDTLVAGRDICTPSGDQPEGNHFPILENVRKVMPDDVIISDYYDQEKAHRILRKVTSLANRLYVGSGIKLNGKIWRQLKVDSHTGDQPYEIAGARRAGVKATMVHVSPFTQTEQRIYDAGLSGLALSIREARLISYDPTYRQLQLLQNQANFPFLFLASVLLHRKMICEGMNCLLMCSRDAFLWHRLQDKVRRLHGACSYDIHYFYTSRLTRYFPSTQILKYSEAIITNRTLIVDVSGSGQSLKRFVKQLSLRPSLWLLVGYIEPRLGSFSPVPYAIEWHGATAIELANLANHPMICDVAHNSENSFDPIFTNPTNIDWANIPEINAMHEAFHLATSTMQNYNFSTDLQIAPLSLIGMLRSLLECIDRENDVLKSFAESFFSEEEHHTRDKLWRQTMLAAPDA